MTAQTAPVTLAEMASIELKRANGDNQKAAASLSKKITASANLMRKLFGPYISTACYDAVRAQTRMQRNAIVNVRIPTHEQNMARIGALASVTVNSWRSFPLPGGVALENASGHEVLRAADSYLKQGGTMLLTGRWLKLVAQQFTDLDHRCPASLTNKRLAELRARATTETDTRFGDWREGEPQRVAAE